VALVVHITADGPEQLAPVWAQLRGLTAFHVDLDGADVVLSADLSGLLAQPLPFNEPEAPAPTKARAPRAVGGPYSLDALLEHKPADENADAFRRRLKVSGAQWIKHRENGINWRTADMLAVRLGLHPSNIWPEWNDEVDLDEELPDTPAPKGTVTARVLAYMAERPYGELSANDLALAVSSDRATVSALLTQMERRGTVERVARGRYRIAQ
jgi:hypothetical protein